MDWDWVVTLGAVLLGFMLGQGARYIEEEIRRRRAERFIKQELETNLAMIPQHLDRLVKMQKSAKQEELLFGEGVRFMTTAYEQGAELAFKRFSLLERDNLHFFYWYFRRTDEFMETYKDFALRMIESKHIKAPFAGFVGVIGDFINQMNLAQEMVKEFLDGKPRDVLYRNLHDLPEPGRFK